MPIYEYQCEKCHHCFELLVFTSDEEDAACPECSHRKVKRLMSSTCFIGSSGGSGCSKSSSQGFS